MGVKPTDEPRIGVFVCDCGSNIRGVVDVPETVKYAKTLQNVIHSEEATYLCSADFQSKIKERIKDQNLNRVVVACCTPRTHEPLFRETCKEAGLNPYLLEFTGIREHCSWVHMHEPKEATEKAKDLIRMGVARARLLQPQEELKIPVGQESLIIGGGIGGMTAALTLADMGFKVKLIEREEELGGMLKRIFRVFPNDTEPEKIIKPMMKAVHEHANIVTYTGTEVRNISGYVGKYNVRVLNKKKGLEDEFEVSTIIVATGAKEIDPTGHYGFGKFDEVITQLQLEQMLKKGALKKLRNIVMINCVGSRGKGVNNYCCNVGCWASLKNAKYIKELHPDTNIYILYRDLMVFGGDEQEYLEDARGKMVNFIRYSDNQEPEVYINNGKLTVKTYAPQLTSEVKIEADLVVLSVALEGTDGVKELREMLKVPVGAGNFFREGHVKLQPLNFATEGIYLCGAAHSPKGVVDTIHQASGAAMKASIPMGRGFVKAEGITSIINLELCKKCGLCAKFCSYGAITLSSDRVPQNIPALCKGCGTCAAECPSDAITMRHYTDTQIMAQIDAALAERPEEKILAFCCNWCSYAAADLAGVSRFQYPTNIRIIRVMCSGRVDRDFIYRAFEKGAGMVLVAGCDFPTCHYISGNYAAKERIERLKKGLESKGINSERLRVAWISAAEGKKFAELVNEMVEQMKQLSARPPMVN